MTNKEAWEQYKEYSQTTSDIARKFAFAGIAICWMFKSEGNGLPDVVSSALLFLIAYFVFDLFHYLIASFLYRYWIRKDEIQKWEQTGKIEGEYYNPTWIDKPALFFFSGKIIVLIIAYVQLGSWLFRILNFR